MELAIGGPFQAVGKACRKVLGENSPYSWNCKEFGKTKPEVCTEVQEGVIYLTHIY